MRVRAFATIRAGQAGFTLLEVTLTVLILSSLAAVAIPLFGKVDSTKIDRAKLDCGQIADALMTYMKDTRLRPTGRDGTPGIRALMADRGSPPRLPIAVRSTSLDSIVRTNTWASSRWRGPYMDSIPPDPWGQRYVVWTVNYHTSRLVWVLSAGPDGTLQTSPDHASPQGDDIGVSIQ